ncbi:uncharacterized protein LOC129226691 [Uloborus diversus]|uniref:uncharacterized protein LOC129226691 n=1 Tax=Uloborus diversus TaxID=327109 RepID=UPI00240945D6|nr:uncharacterized protein LOC129226691 [Uloborus diversus]
MWKGLATTELYEEFLRNGLCAEHSKEFILASKNADVVELRTELQRKALLFIRLRMFDPIVFKRPCVSSKLMDLLSREEDVPKRENGNLDDFIEKFTLFDSVLVFIICYFSRICCIGALFLRKTKLEVNPDVPLIGILQNVLEKKHLLESEINVLFPLLQKNFSDLDPDQIRLTYVATLLFIRSYIRRKTLKFVTDQLAAELKMSTECQELNLMGNEAYKKEQYKAAIELYDSALSKNPYSYMILSNRAQAYKKLGKYKEAQLDCYIAVAINPTWCLGYCKLSSSLYCQQLYDQAFYVAEYGLSKCKNNQSKDYETLESLKLEASFKKSPTKTIKENTSKSMLSKKNISDKTSSNEKEIKKEKDSPEHLENAQNHSSSIQKELQKETKISEKNVPDKTSPGEKEIKKEKDTPEHLKNIPDKTSSNEKEIKKEKDSPEHLENAQNLSASSQKELQKETEISENMHHGVSEEKECREEATTEKAKIGNSSSTPKKADEFQKIPNENVRIGIDSSVLKKADEFQEIPDENVEQEKDPPSSEINHGETREKTESANEEKKAVNPSEENLTQLSPQKDVPPLLEAPESDDSYSEAAPPLMEAPESDNSDSEAAPPLMEAPESEDSNSEEVPPLLEAPSESDDSYYEDEAEFESPPNEIIQEETALECNAGRQGHESNLEQNIEKAAPPLMEAPESEDSDPELEPDTVSKASGVTSQSPSEIQDKSCGTSDELFQEIPAYMRTVVNLYPPFPTSFFPEEDSGGSTA